VSAGEHQMVGLFFGAHKVLVGYRLSSFLVLSPASPPGLSPLLLVNSIIDCCLSQLLICSIQP